MSKNKIVPIPDMQTVHYEGFAIDWIEYRGYFRVYRPEKPYETVGYADSLNEARTRIDEEKWRYTNR